jgi:hypothetical protein
MEKKYRIKEELRKMFSNELKSETFTLSKWGNYGFKVEALEEVDQRIELKRNPRSNGSVSKANEGFFTNESILLMEQAINGELFSIDLLSPLHKEWLSIDGDYDFINWLEKNHKK